MFYKMHAPEPEISYRTYAQMLLATDSECTLRHADDPADFVQGKRSIRVRRPEFLQPRHHPEMVATADPVPYRRAMRQALVHDMLQSLV